MRLSVLDQSTASLGRTQDTAIRETLELARHCELLGYHRFWLSEHHNSGSIVGTAPEILMAAIAATTSRIRIGSAGVMLPHYSALKVAEQFRVLEAIAPGRIDLGVGRAPGSDQMTAYALALMKALGTDRAVAELWYLKTPMKVIRREYKFVEAEERLSELLSKYVDAVTSDEWPAAERSYCDRVKCGFRERCWGAN